MKRLSKGEIEEIANRVLKSYKRLPGLQDGPVFRIDPELLVTKLLKLNLYYYRLPDGMELAAVTSDKPVNFIVVGDRGHPDPKTLGVKDIFVEKKLDDDPLRHTERNFVICHEASLKILNMLYPNKNTVVIDPIHYCYENQRSTHNWIEWQANKLAYAVMMPRELLMQAMGMFGFGARIEFLPDTNKEKEMQFKGMAQFLGVSRDVMSARLQELKLLGTDYIRDPWLIRNVEEDICV